MFLKGQLKGLECCLSGWEPHLSCSKADLSNVSSIELHLVIMAKLNLQLHLFASSLHVGSELDNGQFLLVLLFLTSVRSGCSISYNPWLSCIPGPDSASIQGTKHRWGWFVKSQGIKKFQKSSSDVPQAAVTQQGFMDTCPRQSREEIHKTPSSASLTHHTRHRGE